jgi:hypothetical protein
MSDKLPSGFECTCGAKHLFPAYVYAHWRDLMDFVCSDCGRKWKIVTGGASGRNGKVAKAIYESSRDKEG